jgi:hypothetical protein
LAAENLGRVAAAASEIKDLLTKDAGMMVELKQWVARDATEHGQVVSDSDLSSEGIFARLESDVQFRSIATALVRQYGYLLPKLNPDSDTAKEHDFLFQERVRRLSQDQEEELARARQPGTRDLKPEVSGLDLSESQPGSQSRPLEPNLTNPPDGGESPKMREPLLQAAEGSRRNEPQLALANSLQPMLPFDDAAISVPGGPNSRSDEAGRSRDAFAAGESSGSANFSQGMPAESEMATNFASEGVSDGKWRSAEKSSHAASGLPMASRSYSRGSPVAISEPPEMIRRHSPYESIPSLYDMYVQAVTRPAAPGRFGAEVFRNGSRDSQLIPMDLPVGPDYVVGPGDGLAVDLWGGVSQRFYRVVDRQGRVSLPEVGPVLVSGKSLAAVQQSVQQVLRTEFRGVSADVSLARLRTIRVYEVGDVANPGAYDISSL